MSSLCTHKDSLKHTHLQTHSLKDLPILIEASLPDVPYRLRPVQSIVSICGFLLFLGLWNYYGSIQKNLGGSFRLIQTHASPSIRPSMLQLFTHTNSYAYVKPVYPNPPLPSYLFPLLLNFPPSSGHVANSFSINSRFCSIRCHSCP